MSSQMLTPSKLNVAVMQMTSVDNVETNWHQFEQIAGDLYKTHAHVDIICLPENALYLRLKENEKITGLTKEHPLFQRFAKFALEKRTAIHIGASPIEIDGKLYNSSIFFKSTGEFQFSYQKIHLFDIQLTDQKPFRESDIFTHGDKPSIFSIGEWRFGESICYDIRFSELYSYYAKNNVDVILVPAAFLRKTGQAHWQVLLRARAIESQCFVVAAAQCGIHQNLQGGYRETYGHSMIIDPWGEVQQIKEDDIGYLFCSLDKERVHQVRKQIPMLSHRRFKP